MALAMKATVTTISSKPWRFSRSMMCSIIGRLASGSIGLGCVRGERAQPGAFAAGHDHGLHQARTYPRVVRHEPLGRPEARRRAIGMYEQRGVLAQDQARMPKHPGRGSRTDAA